MSEYQYYEFAAVDRPLSTKEIDQVGGYSSRAEISSTRFKNVYNFGNFRGDPHEFLSRWYDAMVYVANWGTRQFMFRVPADSIDIKTARLYCPGQSASVRKAGEWLIFDLDDHPEDGGDGGWEEGEGNLDGLLPIRSAVVEGDLRALYIGWLLCVQAGELDEDDLEPPVPPGLKSLNTPLKDLADFLRIDDDLLAAAAKNSPPLTRTLEGLAEWVVQLPEAEKTALLLGAVEGETPHLGAELRRRFLATRPLSPATAPRRTVKELEQAAEALAEKHEREAAERVAAERAGHLARLARRQDQVWREVEQFIEQKNQEGYAQAVKLLIDLREVAVQSKALPGFEGRVAELVRRHAKKLTFMDKLHKARLDT